MAAAKCGFRELGISLISTNNYLLAQIIWRDCPLGTKYW